jgi:ABC-2 type transport system ATP-binding protein
MADIEQVCERVMIINTGKIVFDGRLQDLNGMNQVRKQIRVIFDGQWSTDQVGRLGKIIEKNGQEVLLEVESDKAAKVASNLFASFPVKDIGITSPPLEKLIESIYLKERE